MDDEEVATGERRQAEWRPNDRPEITQARWRFDEMVFESVRLDRCREREADWRLEESRRAAPS